MFLLLEFTMKVKEHNSLFISSKQKWIFRRAGNYLSNQKAI